MTMRAKSWVPMYYIEDAEWDDASETRWSLDADGCLRGDCGLPCASGEALPSKKWTESPSLPADMQCMANGIVDAAMTSRYGWLWPQRREQQLFW